MTATEPTMLRKVMRIGTIQTGGFCPTQKAKRSSIYIKVEAKSGRLSFSGVIGPRKSGDADGGCGQIDMEFAHRNAKDNDKRYTKPVKPSAIAFASGWDTGKWYDLLDAWKRWHLNDTRAGTPAQEAWLRENPVDATYPKSHYEEASKALAAAGLNPDNGYSYGSAWKSEEVPQEVLDFIISLPDADLQPAWC